MIKIVCPRTVKYNGCIYDLGEEFLIDEKDLPELQKYGATVLQETVTKKDIKKEEPKAKEETMTFAESEEVKSPKKENKKVDKE